MVKSLNSSQLCIEKGCSYTVELFAQTALHKVTFLACEWNLKDALFIHNMILCTFQSFVGPVPTFLERVAGINFRMSTIKCISFNIK